MRRIYWAVAWLFLASVVVQVLLVGLALFAGESFELHAFFGFSVVHLLSLLLIPLAALARAGRGSVLLAVGLFIVIGVQVSLPGLRTTLPLAAALHPVNALLIFWLGLQITRRADALRLVAAAPTPPQS
ncbi:MAG: DUF6220 domain-containing protein [Candidatus Limnocylindria bacterium]